MDIIVKGRHTGVSERFREYVTSKLGKIAKLNQKVIRVDVEVSKERNPRLAGRRESVELTIRSRGPVIRAEASADDRFAALDIAVDKLEARLRKMADRRKVHHGNHAPLSVAAITAPFAGGHSNRKQAAEPSHRTSAPAQRSSVENVPRMVGAPRSAADDAENIVPIAMEGEGPLVVREKFHEARPMTIDQALFEMELVGHDFYLFRDAESGSPSVVYRRHGYDYGVIRLIER